MATVAPHAATGGPPPLSALTLDGDGVPPLARRPVISPAMALREEISDSWRLLGASLGAAGLAATVLYLLALALG